MGAPRIAVIAVHGVADQSPGATARAVVDLLVASAPTGSDYQAIDTESLTLRVDPLPSVRQPGKKAADPVVPLPSTEKQVEPAADAAPLGEERSWLKSVLQSRRSDFQRQHWKTPESAGQVKKEFGNSALELKDDRGIAFTDFLLGKNRRNGADPEGYETTRIGMQRNEAGVQSRIDVFEMYWADLSRLSGVLPRIITELFTMVFRLSKLGRDTVDEAREAMRVKRKKGLSYYRGVWGLVAELQIGLDWLFVNGMALLFLQLALLGVLMLGLGLIATLDPLVLSHLDAAVAGLIATAGMLLLAYRHREPTFAQLRMPGALFLAGCVALASLYFSPRWAPWLSILALLGAITHANLVGLRVADDRFPLVRKIGLVMWFVFTVLFLLSAAQQFVATSGATGLESGIWMRSALFVAEVCLSAIKWLWIGVGLMLGVWLIAGWLAAQELGYESKASIATGRLGLGMSFGAFLAISMTVWALLSGVLASAAGSLQYSPCIFPDGRPAGETVSRAASAGAVNPCVWRTDAVTEAHSGAASELAAAGSDAAAFPPIVLAASDFLDLRYRASTSGFVLVAGLLTGLFVFLMSMFVPSVLAEMKLLITRARSAVGGIKGRRPEKVKERLKVMAAIDDSRSRRLGHWLTGGYRRLDGFTNLVFTLGVGMAGLVALDYFGLELPLISRYEPAMQNFSQLLLKPLVISAASISASLMLFGGLLSKHLPGLRAPLDLALDVDNHFREFPRRGIPRARIFSRYAALLRHVSAGNYDRIVVVSHSQGSVISTELLRYLSSDGENEPGPDARPSLADVSLPSIQILTMGCPLRQLYAARFPTLYRWVLSPHGSFTGPRACDIGVTRWINAYCSGDYVGRWLWSTNPDPDSTKLGHPMVDAAGPEFGRKDAYSGFDPMPPDAQAFGSARQIEVCLGLGAHTHYFEADQKTVAWLIDGLLRDSASAGQAKPAGAPSSVTAMPPKIQP